MPSEISTLHAVRIEHYPVSSRSTPLRMQLGHVFCDQVRQSARQNFHTPCSSIPSTVPTVHSWAGASEKHAPKNRVLLSWVVGGICKTIKNLREPRCQNNGSWVWRWQGSWEERLLALPNYTWAHHQMHTAKEIWYKGATKMHRWRDQF